MVDFFQTLILSSLPVIRIVLDLFQMQLVLHYVESRCYFEGHGASIVEDPQTESRCKGR
jgi:hypothetical protein